MFETLKKFGVAYKFAPPTPKGEIGVGEKSAASDVGANFFAKREEFDFIRRSFA